MSLGYALTEQYPARRELQALRRSTARWACSGPTRSAGNSGSLWWRSHGLNVAGGAIGIGEITSIPTAPAIADAYFWLDAQRRLTLPLENTPYARKK